ncbi:MAG: hypothetical protein AAF637_27650, partial [Pseudomonadota bacterium]
PVARQAHNLKVVGSNPTPATNRNAASPSGSAALLVAASQFHHTISIIPPGLLELLVGFAGV